MKRTIISSVSLLFILVLTLGHAVQAAMTITGPTWRVVEIGGNPVAAGELNREPHLVFSPEGRISGSTGCNRFTGTYQLDGRSLRFSPLAMTKMACPPPLAALENTFLQALTATVSVRESKSCLELLDALGKVQMRLQAR